MRHSREEIYQAFFDLVSQAPGIVTASRRTQHFANVLPEQQPALFVEQIGENPSYQGKGIPYSWHLDVMIGVYVFSGDTTIAPTSLINPIVDAIEGMFPPGDQRLPGRVQTLGGLAQECRLLGEGKAQSGSLGSQAFAYIPVRIFAV